MSQLPLFKKTDAIYIPCMQFDLPINKQLIHKDPNADDRHRTNV